jgi:hypothetical protein
MGSERGAESGVTYAELSAAHKALIDAVERGSEYRWDAGISAWVWSSGNPKHPGIVFPGTNTLWKRAKARLIQFLRGLRR